MTNAIRFSPQEIYLTLRKVEEISNTIWKLNQRKPVSSNHQFRGLFKEVFEQFSLVNTGAYKIITLKGLHISAKIENNAYKVRLFGYIKGYTEAVDIQTLTQATNNYDPQFSEVAEHVNEVMAKLIKTVNNAYQNFDVDDKEKRKKLIESINGGDDE